MLIRVKQIDPAEFAAAVLQYSTGSAFSGAINAYVNAGGYLGTGSVLVTGNQDITGIKRFFDGIRVPYFAGTGFAPTALYVTDQIAAASGAGYNQLSSLSGFIAGASGNLSTVRVTGSGPIANVNLTGLGGTLVFSSGGFVFISGGAGGGGGGSSNTSVTGSSPIAAPNFTGVGSVTLTYDGTYVRVSGAGAADSSGYFENNFVHRGLVNDIISGLKTYTGAVGVGNPTATGHAVNLGYLTGVSGVIAGAAGSITNTFNITGTGTINNTFNASGNVYNTFNVSGNVINGGTTINLGTVTGNFVNLSFFFEAYNLVTGLNQVESFVARDFTFTGYAVGAQTSGTQGFLSGSLYQRTQTGGKVPFRVFSLNSGQFMTGVGGLFQTISGLNRVGIDILNLGTGMTGVTVGLFGVGY